MDTRIGFGLSLAVLFFAGGCARSAKVNSAHLEEAGTHVVTTPGALTIARLDGSSPHVCTLRTPASPHGMKKGKGVPMGPPAAGPAQVLDVLLFRLCEARANNDLSAEQYAASVQVVLKTMSELTERQPPVGPGPAGPWGRRGGRGGGFGPGMPGRGMFGPGMRGPGRPWQDDGDDDGDRPRWEKRRRDGDGPPPDGPPSAPEKAPEKPKVK